MQSAIGLAEFKTREQAAYEVLRRAIIDGRLGPGEGLVVSRLAADLGVSRITVANALKRLAGEDFVRLTPHKEAAVTPLAPEDIREIYLMRAELEALAAQEAAPKITGADLTDLHDLNDEIGRRKERLPLDIRSIRAADLDFHHRMREIAVMPYLAQTLQNLADRCEGYRARTLDERQLVVPGPERHSDILVALDSRNAGASAIAMRRHVLAGMDAVLDVLGRSAVIIERGSPTRPS
ncbi:MAG: GntR family transcriptional regulator [Thermomicrobiales bacterium]